jgi:ectoine hydroxylase-related dioxygenase (phytanoyl-CoA dioxygenase family)
VLNRGQVEEFAGRGFLVVPRVVPPEVVAAAAHGPDAFFAAGGYPPIRLPEPEQVTGEAGDLLLAHYLLGHNIGGNTSPTVRRAVYFRVKRAGHDPRWREFLTDPWLDYDAVRHVLA